MVPSHRQARTLARGLGWFSIGLGVVQLVAAPGLARVTGLRGLGGLVRASGVREVLNGIGLLSTQKPAPWLWARVGGGVLDMATLASGLQGARTGGASVALAAVAAVTALDVAAARSLSTQRPAPARDYSMRSGWPAPVEAMRGAALSDFKAPADMSIPQSLRPWPHPGMESRPSTTRPAFDGVRDGAIPSITR